MLWVPLVEQELPTLPEHISSHPVFSVVRVTVLCVCFVDRCYLYICRKKTKSKQTYETPLNVINSHSYEEPDNDKAYYYID
jgi:hypothetical protein